MEQDTTEGFFDASIFGIDVIAYSQRGNDGQIDAQGLMDQLLDEAAASATVIIYRREWLDGGDGGFFVLQGDTRAAWLLAERFAPLLARENAMRVERNQIHVRIALHSGDVAIWTGTLGRKIASPAINDCARLLGGMGNAHRGQVVCSKAYRERLVNAQIQPDHFVRLRDIHDKHGRRHEVWNVRRTPGFGVEPPLDERYVPDLSVPKDTAAPSSELARHGLAITYPLNHSRVERLGTVKGVAPAGVNEVLVVVRPVRTSEHWAQGWAPVEADGTWVYMGAHFGEVRDEGAPFEIRAFAILTAGTAIGMPTANWPVAEWRSGPVAVHR